MTKNLSSYLGPTMGAIIFLVALWVMHRDLKLIDYHEIVDSLKQIPTTRLMVALAATDTNYVVLTGYDWLAFHYIRRPLQYSKIALASFYSRGFFVGIPLEKIRRTGSLHGREQPQPLLPFASRDPP